MEEVPSRQSNTQHDNKVFLKRRGAPHRRDGDYGRPRLSQPRRRLDPSKSITSVPGWLLVAVAPPHGMGSRSDCKYYQLYTRVRADWSQKHPGACSLLVFVIFRRSIACRIGVESWDGAVTRKEKRFIHRLKKRLRLQWVAERSLIGRERVNIILGVRFSNETLSVVAITWRRPVSRHYGTS